MPARRPFFTIGHSTRTIGEFVALVAPHGIGCVVDVRTVTRSRTNPQFNADAFAAALAAHGLDYTHMPALGGLRGKSRAVPADTNALWRNASFRNYADHALTPEFRAGLDALRALGRETTCAVMCAEAVWWRCHRRIIADWLIAAGETVLHIMGEGRAEPARLTPGARVAADGVVTYPATAAAS